MADELTVELVAADRTVWSGPATMVLARTVEGDIGILRGHAPVLSVLTEAVIEITDESGHVTFAVADGGFISVAGDRVSILSERAELSDEVDISDARAELEAAKEGHLDPGSPEEHRLRLAEARLRMAERASGGSASH